ncbi:MAG: hypothetical protein ACR2ND_12270 [Solirubrobacteraceae bacterium]
MVDDDPLEPLARWLTDQRAVIDIAGQVTVQTVEHGEGDRTKVTIDHLLSCPLSGYDGWRVTTKKTFLPLGQFSSHASFCLKTSDHTRGRTIYCKDRSLDDEVVAAMSYHVDERPSWPVFVTTIGYHGDGKRDAEMRRRTVSGAFVIKQYVHAISDAIGRGGFVHIDAARDGEIYARELGFSKAPRIKGLRVAGTHMRQPPLDQDSESGIGG